MQADKPTASAARAAARGRHYRYYDLIMAAFVTVLLCSNLIGAGKSCEVVVFGTAVVFGAGNVFFPISYIFGDILTEVYGYARSRRVIWAGFGGLAFASVMSALIVALPPNPKEPLNDTLQPALALVFGNTFRIVLASMTAFWAGDFANSFVLAKLKILTRGKHLWFRFIGSTAVGQAVDSLLFYPLAFAGTWTVGTLVDVILFNWFFKVTVETLLVPVTYFVVRWLKRAEKEDFYDYDTNFTPFSLKA